MGDRGNIVVRHGDGQFVHIYSHWRGSDLHRVLHEVLSVDDSLRDEAYLTHRIAVAVSKLCGGESVGISCRYQDNEQPVFMVDPENGTVTKWSSRRYMTWDTAPPTADEVPLQRWTFAEYVRDYATFNG